LAPLPVGENFAPRGFARSALITWLKYWPISSGATVGRFFRWSSSALFHGLPATYFMSSAPSLRMGDQLASWYS
jgi:hypothetical protein